MPPPEPYVVTGFEEASAILRGAGWSSDPRRNPLAPREVLELPPGALVFMDPPDHTRLRTFLSPAFTPRAVERLRPRVAAIVDAVLDGLAGEEYADVLEEIGYLVPLAVVTELLDAGIEGAELFREQTPALFRLLEVEPSPDDLKAGTGASTELMMFLTPLIAERRTRPGGDFISAMLSAPDGPRLEEVLATCMLLLAAGHETTANLIANGVRAVLAEPRRRAGFLADPARAVEELLRLEGAVKLVGRVALTDHEQVPAGGMVLIRIDAANRDPRRYDDPERLDFARPQLPHLAFGGGPHFCLGAALARLEIGEALTRLFTRFPGMELAGEPRWRESTTFHGLTGLPVRLGAPTMH
jgi:cytochrome P450